MSIEAMAIVLHHSRASAADKLVLLGIANHEGDGGAYPAIGTLARYANIEPRAVQRSLARLTQLGEVHVVVKGGGRVDSDPRYRTNRYDILVSCPPTCDRSKNHRPLNPEVSPTTPLTNPEVASTTSRGGVGDHPEVASTTPKPSLEPSKNRPLLRRYHPDSKDPWERGMAKLQAKADAEGAT